MTHNQVLFMQILSSIKVFILCLHHIQMKLQLQILLNITSGRFYSNLTYGNNASLHYAIFTACRVSKNMRF